MPNPETYRLPTPVDLHEALRSDGAELLHRPWRAWAWSGLAGGLSVALSVLTAAAIHAAVPSAPWTRLVVAVGTTIGYLVIILGRQGLITESTMITALEVLSRPSATGIRRFAGVVAVVSSFNLLGALLAAIVLARTQILETDQRLALAELAGLTTQPGFFTLFARSTIGGWAIALAVWTAPAAGSAKVFTIFALAYLTGLLHFTHLAAGSIEAIYLSLTGQLPWHEYLTRFLPPVLAGNFVGGFVLVAVLNHLQVKRSPRAR